MKFGYNVHNLNFVRRIQNYYYCYSTRFLQRTYFKIELSQYNCTSYNLHHCNFCNGFNALHCKSRIGIRSHLGGVHVQIECTIIVTMKFMLVDHSWFLGFFGFRSNDGCRGGCRFKLLSEVGVSKLLLRSRDWCWDPDEGCRSACNDLGVILPDAIPLVCPFRWVEAWVDMDT